MLPGGDHLGSCIYVFVILQNMSIMQSGGVVDMHTVTLAALIFLQQCNTQAQQILQ